MSVHCQSASQKSCPGSGHHKVQPLPISLQALLEHRQACGSHLKVDGPNDNPFRRELPNNVKNLAKGPGQNNIHLQRLIPPVQTGRLPPTLADHHKIRRV